MKSGGMRSELSKRLSPKAFAELVEKFGGRLIRVPRSKGPAPRSESASRRERRERVRVLAASHLTYEEIARELGVSRSTVIRDAKKTT